MKKGKTITLNQYDSIKSFYGTVDAKELKSIYLNIQTWVTPLNEEENWNRVVSLMTREVKHSVLHSINTDLFKPHFIVDLDLRTSGIRYNKKSFMNLEINLFTKEDGDFKCHEIKDSVKKILKRVYKDNVLNNNHFNFSPTKNSEIYQTIE
jgi:hypothetical protein